MMPQFAPSSALRQDLARWIRASLGVSVILFIASIVGAFFSPHDFFRSYLTGFLICTGLALGSLGILMLQYLTGGAWGVVSRRTLEAATRTLPLLALLFIPIAFGIPFLYDWAHPELVVREAVLQHRHEWMNPTLFIVRTIVYFAIWILFAWLLNKWSADEDKGGAEATKFSRLSAPGLIVYVFTVTFSSVDWAESLTTDWYSTMWGFLFVAMQCLSSMAFVIVVLGLLAEREPMSHTLRPVHFHDLGKMLLMFVMIWAYFSFSQLLIVWEGDLAGEITWYIRRMNTSWGWFGGALIVFQFIIPFLLLLSRPLKRNRKLLAGVVGLLLAMRFVEMFWIVMPSYYQRGFRLVWLNFTTPLALIAIWCAAFCWELGKRPLMPLHAPNLEAALQHVEA